MAPPMKHTKQSNDSHDDTETPSNNLWVGNLSLEVTDSDLMDLFTKYGALDSLTTYSSRNFAFLFFKRVEDAKAAKEALQGAMLRGNPIKIEFARPARPCKNLWIGGINPSVSKEELEKEFRKFGKINDFKFLRDRNTAAVEYTSLEDASEAMRNLNGKQFGGEQIRVDFLRSQTSRREQWHNSHEPRDGPFLGRGMGPSDLDSGFKRLHSQASGMRKEGQPSRVLWVGYPPSIQIDEQMLHNAMILFGEIESIKTFPSRHYAFVEFRSIDEARRAKEGLQGRLFNNPRITIMFSSSDLAPGPGKDHNPGFNPGIKGPRPDMFFSEQSLRPSQMDIFGHNFPGPPPRPYMPSNHFGPEIRDLAAHPGWRRPSSPGLLPSPQGIRPNKRIWDSYDERSPKRSRMEDRIMLEQSYGLGGPIIDGGAHGRSHYSPPVGSKVRGGGDYIWRGIIAKGGTPVCQARCVPIGKGLETELPEVVNCTARTGLDMLTKHYAEAIGFDIVFFLPDSEDDFASYTEFLHYLAAKDRAGVAKFDNGTTLFLVPPSDFLTKVLKVTGPERLYGVVLRLPQQNLNSGIVQQESHQSVPLSQYADGRPDYIRATEEKVLPDYNRILREESNFPARSHFSPGESRTSQYTHEYAPSNITSVSQSGVKLTPELISTLASFLPGNSQSSSQESVRPSKHQSVAPNNWNQDHRASEPAAHFSQPSGNQYNSQTRQPHIQNYPSVNLSFGNAQFQDMTADLARQDVVSSRTFNTHPVPQNARYSPSLPTNRPYQPDVPPNTQKTYEMARGFDASGSYNPLFPQAQTSTAMHNQVYGANFSQPQNVGPTSTEKVFVEASNQAHQLQSGLSDSGQGMPEGEVDKNQRYQSTLQFAANLLLQIQQKQQQTNTGVGQGGGYQP